MVRLEGVEMRTRLGKSRCGGDDAGAGLETSRWPGGGARRRWGTDHLGPCRPYLVRHRLLEGFE